MVKAALSEWECGYFKFKALLSLYIKKICRLSRKNGIYQENFQDIKKSKNISRNFKFYRENLKYIKKRPLPQPTRARLSPIQPLPHRLKGIAIVR